MPAGGDPELTDNELWLEVDIAHGEVSDEEPYPSIPPFFTHMALESQDGAPRVRIRLTATLDADGYIDEKIEYITQVDADGQPTQRSDVTRHDRAAMEVHYLPARRDPVDHISYTAASLLGRILRAADWTGERAELARLTEEISTGHRGNVVTDYGSRRTAVLLVDPLQRLHLRGREGLAYVKDVATAVGSWTPAQGRVRGPPGGRASDIRPPPAVAGGRLKGLDHPRPPAPPADARRPRDERPDLRPLHHDLGRPERTLSAS
jgi:hypothetical protein